MYNYFRFNGTLINDFYIVTSISHTLRPKFDYDSLDIPSKDGIVFNGGKYAPLEYDIQILIEGDTQEEYKEKVQMLRDLFDVREPKAIQFTEDKFGYGLPTDAITLTEKNLTTSIATVHIVCFVPYFYSTDIKTSFGSRASSKWVNVENNGTQPVKPFMSVSVDADSQFVQIENANTGETILLGNYPQIELPNTVNEKEVVLYDDCTSSSKWTTSASSLDGNKDSNGTVSIASNGNGIILGSVGDGSSLWKGAQVRRNLSSSADEFEVIANIVCASTGTNGDPTKVALDVETITSGSRTEYYKTTADALNVRSGPSTSYKSIGVVNKGYGIYQGVIQSNGWIKFEYPKIGSGTYGYCSGKYIEKYYKDSTTTITKCNMVTNAELTPLKPSPSSSSKTIFAMSPGWVLRVIYSNQVSETVTVNGQQTTYKWVQLAEPVTSMTAGKVTGWVRFDQLIQADKAAINRPVTGETADDKTGAAALYGVDSTGSILFRLCMYDQNLYYEYSRPDCKIGNTIVLQESSNPPAPKADWESDGSGNIKVTNYLSGAYGDWNDGWNHFICTRKKDSSGNYVWNFTVQHIVGGVVKKTLKAGPLKSSKYPTNPLAGIILYLGTSGEIAKSSDLALTDVQVSAYNSDRGSTNVNVKYFKAGDIIDIDFENRNVYVNNVPANHLVDIGSVFFDIPPGLTSLRLTSDNSNATLGVALREKWIGAE